MDSPPVIIQLLGLLISISACGSGAFVLFRELRTYMRVRKTGILVQGQIIGFEEDKSGDSITYPAVVSYTTNAGDKITAISRTSSGTKPTIGKLVWIIYDPLEPSHFYKQAIMLCVNWHPSEEFFVIGDYGHNWEGENVPSLLHFWSADGKHLKSIAGSKGEYRNISWNKSGTLLATASDVLRIWSKDGILLQQAASDSTNYLWGIDWNAEGKRIVTSSRFETIALWDSTAKLIRRTDLALPHTLSQVLQRTGRGKVSVAKGDK